MSGIRQSIVFRQEQDFGDGGSGDWYFAPPGSFFTFTYGTNTSRINAMGRKVFETVAYGTESGSWTWNFVFDYAYLEPFYIYFDQAQYDTATGEIVFSKVNSKRVRSFCFREVKLNRIAGGSVDEGNALLGAVPKTLRMTCSAGASQINCTIEGVFQKVLMTPYDFDETDYTPYEGELSRFLCMSYGDPKTVEPERFIDSLSIGMDNGASLLPVVCTSFAQRYYEGYTNNQFSVSAYSNELDLKQRTFAGGAKLTPAPIGPQVKNKAMCPKICLAAYDLAVGDTNAVYDDGGATREIPTITGENGAFNKSWQHLIIDLTNSIYKSITWNSGESGRIQDQLSGVNVQDIKLRVKTGYYAAAPSGSDGRYIYTSLGSMEAAAPVGAPESVDTGMFPRSRSKQDDGLVKTSISQSGSTYIVTFIIENQVRKAITAIDGSTISAPTDLDVNADEWYTDAAMTVAFVWSTEITQDTVLYGKPNMYVTFKWDGAMYPADPNGPVSNPLAVPKGDPVQGFAISGVEPPTGKQFAGWYVDQPGEDIEFMQPGTGVQSIAVTRNMNVYARFTEST